jgi:hypothetical protein
MTIKLVLLLGMNQLRKKNEVIADLTDSLAPAYPSTPGSQLWSLFL